MSDAIAESVEVEWSAWCETLADAGERVPDTAALVADLKRVWGASGYVAQSCKRDPGLLPGLLNSGQLQSSYTAGEMAGQLAGRLADASDETALHKILRQFRRQQMVRIICRDIAGWAPLGETLEDLSELADITIQQSLVLLYDWTCREMGTPRNAAGEAQSLLVLGMGKLGARELNLSSDIDLIFAYPEPGETDGPRPRSNEQFFIRLCQRLVQALDTVNPDGFVFRVDTRLRPFGSVGPLAMHFDAMENYYHSQAREWERYAMIKARLVAGDPAAGEVLMALLRPFVYRRYLDFGAIESLRKMKRMISAELHKKGMDANIKLGAGGIREIEFIGQAFQLIRGGRDSELQIRPILSVLKRLQQKEYLPEYVVRELAEAYAFLRLVENRIQAWADRQTHLLPTDEGLRLRLARAMGFDSWEPFAAALARHRQRVQGHFDKVFAAPQAEVESDSQPLSGVWDESMEPEEAQAALAEAGFNEVVETHRRLQRFHGCAACRGLGTRGRARLGELMPLLLEAAGQQENPDQTLQRLLDLLESIVRRTAYLALLVESPLGLSQLVRLSGVSPWITRLLSRHPILLDELLDPRRLYSPLKRRELEQELEVQLAGIEKDDLEQQMERLRQFTQSNMLRVAAADITGQVPLMVVSDYLTEIAETSIVRVVEQAWAVMVQRYGAPKGLAAGESSFVVIGYGKLGGIELGYSSDLDMLFLHAIDDQFAETDGAKSIPVEVFYARLAQRMIHLFTTRTPSGILYEVDMRLRPNGNSGMMVSSMRTFESYQQEKAWTWEHQALIRARPVAGDPKAKARFEAVRRHILGQPREVQRLRAEVLEMREKMRQSLDKSSAAQFDLKQGRGGIVDIEFMVQYAVLRWAHQHPELLEWTDNVRLLETLSRLGLLAGDTAELMTGAYKVFRAVYHRNALQDQAALIVDDQLTEERAMVREAWADLMAE
ncbi:Glutamine synthetase adenylyltransferase [endosymbiont of Ridgeia piscesae]|jgi:glutamate-ammonia-ligase adenylyltransferase|uniref:Bifunctional glutamine synthetase adenylyltransferase/adenylyl-removing enzyme n=1 Tax=endosymbiont of Ridgeia piscesae TaxID=54398 RepID=A0A0T5YZS5_9GAMM|nr:bifunctional [glutamate--ammonia ligase]-adenylyl-L-tyrosine phosphorylase/[glutamate--ammonia-ligase] adenylyltransferase [endosymbiont of Ridgeia piscesae]KRT55685.1 Glutamine synthetase adenylyltransferase [endosymbiont of Ridgeia piscesae]